MNIDFWEWQSQCSHSLTAAVDVCSEPTQYCVRQQAIRHILRRAHGLPLPSEVSIPYRRILWSASLVT